MKKLGIISTLFFSVAFAQLRIGADVSRNVSMEASLAGMSMSESESIDGMGFTLGYEQMLLSLLGVGAEYTAGGNDGLNMVFAYGVAKIPVGLPTFRGIIRAGYSKPLEDGMEAGLAYGGGLRFKPPVFPLGVELLYTIHDLKSEEMDEGDDLGLGIEMSTKYSMVNLSLTYSF